MTSTTPEKRLRISEKVKVGINGFGRMGRLTCRVLLSEFMNEMEVVQVNEIEGNVEMAAMVLEFDSIHGRFLTHECSANKQKETIVVYDKRSKVTSEIKFSQKKTPEEIKWDDEVSIIFECTGSFLTVKQLELHKGKNLRNIIVSAPIDEAPVLNVVMGSNDHLITPDMKILTAASCTTNCAAPIIGVLLEKFGIEMGNLTTAHNVTPTQNLMDMMNCGKKNDFRRGRSGVGNMAPTSTGSAKAIALIYPELKNKLNGLAIRVPVQNASITDLNLIMKQDVSVEDINNALKEASKKMPNIIGYEDRALVSADFCNDPRSCIVDSLSTQVVCKRLVKIFAWYDNEWGYCNRMAEIAIKTINLRSNM